jgi:hypothetical protein
MTFTTFLLLVLGGGVAGTIGAMLGLGGGIFLIPYLLLVLDIPMHQAVATSLIAVIATSSAGAAMNVERNVVNLRLGMTLEISTVLGAILGGLTANTLSGKTLSTVFASLLLLVAFLMIWRIRHYRLQHTPLGEGRFPATFRDESTGEDVSYSARRVTPVLLVSLLAGNISGLLGVGGGIFKVPAMNLISGIPIKAAAATSNFMIGVTAAASAFIYFSYGHVVPAFVCSAALGVLGGSYLGIKINRRLKGSLLTWIFAAVLFIISIRMFTR